MDKQTNCPGCDAGSDGNHPCDGCGANPDKKRENLFIAEMSKAITNGLLRITDYLKTNGFFTAPASTKYHSNYECGLFDQAK